MLSLYFNIIESILSNSYLLIAALMIAIAVKSYIFIFLAKSSIRTSQATILRRLLLFVLVGAIIHDLVWIIAIVKNIFQLALDYRWYLFIKRWAWAVDAAQYQAFALFIDKLSSDSPRLSLRSKIFSISSIIFSLFFIVLSIANFNCFSQADRPAIEFELETYYGFYSIFVLMGSTIISALRKSLQESMPLILKKQLRLFIQFLVIPWLISDFIQIVPLIHLAHNAADSEMVVLISVLFLTAATYFCSRRIVSLRFLNLQTHVQTVTKFNFIDGFKGVLNQLSLATSMQELGHITQNLFKEAFNIPLNKTIFVVRKAHSSSNDDTAQSPETNRTSSIIENFIATCTPELAAYVTTSKILTYDEIAFSNFYERSNDHEAILAFLDSIDAAIFLPIYEKQKMIAYIIVEKNARAKFYGNIEQNEMLVFASYVSNIINLLQHRNLKTLIQQEKQLKEELYLKHQEINQYKESIRSFLRNAHQKEIGIIFYKNRHFIFGNKAAKDLIPVNINVHEGHPITKALKSVARHVEEYKTPHTLVTQGTHDNKLVLAGVPNLEHNNVIITVYYPEISDILKQQIDQLKDPSMWDYLLYLETTKSGQLINQLIPGTGETLLAFKIELLKIALSKKALLLDMPEDDLIPTVEIVHHISVRETLHILTLAHHARSNETAIKLCGINQLFSQDQQTKPLLAQLDGTGTLFIQNIHFLDPEAQEHLAEFIRYGYFRPIKSEQKIPSNVRIICSTNQNLQALAHEGAFSKALCNELKTTTLSMPSLLTLSEEELFNLANGMAEQVINTQDLKTLFELTEKERLKLAATRPVSLQEFKKRIQTLLAAKSKKNNLESETYFDPAYQITDPQLINAARLGKQALKDPQIMALLWNKFKSQAKIALFLGVNRSSVNRRCKDFGFE